MNLVNALKSKLRPAAPRDARETAILALRLAPWVVFGPITGIMTERAYRSAQRGERVLAGLYVLANITTLIAIPAVTAGLAARLL